MLTARHESGRKLDAAEPLGARWSRTSPDGSGSVRTDHGGGTKINDSVRVSVEQIGSMHSSAKDLLIADLLTLRQEAGRPSLSELVRRGERKYSKSTLDDHLAGRRSTIPNWRIVAAYVQACHSFAASTGLDVERLGTIEEWRIRWQAAHRGDRIAASPIRDAYSSATYTMVLDDRQHTPDPAGPNKHETVSGSRGETTAGITAIMRRLRVDIPELRESLSPDTGFIIVTNGAMMGSRFVLADDLTMIGRDSENDIVLPDETVSRRHAVIHRYGTRFTVRDAGSRNGTFLHQKQIDEESPLQSGEEMQVGVFRMLFVQGDAEET
jgi:FHA domain